MKNEDQNKLFTLIVRIEIRMNLFCVEIGIDSCNSKLTLVDNYHYLF